VKEGTPDLRKKKPRTSSDRNGLFFDDGIYLLGKIICGRGGRLQRAKFH